MLFINFKILRAIIKGVDSLQDKRAYKQIWARLVKIFSCEFLPLACLFMGKKNFIPIFIGFYVIALQITVKS